MKTGLWHQLGWQGQTLAGQLLSDGIGAGVILSPKDLAYENTKNWADQYIDHGADLIWDPQFYVPSSLVGRLDTYPNSRSRMELPVLLTTLKKSTSSLSRQIETVNRALKTTAVIAPAVPYEAARSDIVELNSLLFKSAKVVADELGIPVYGTVIVGSSATDAKGVDAILSAATSFDADGWYYGFEFAPERIPYDPSEIYHACSGGLTLACTGKPVLHAFAGPMSILSMSFGATACGVGYFQNTWKFDRGRWYDGDAQGGNNKNRRFFSQSLWGTLIQPDEAILLPNEFYDQVMLHSEYSEDVESDKASLWNETKARLHLIAMIDGMVGWLLERDSARLIAESARAHLNDSVSLYSNIRNEGVFLRDMKVLYQANWAAALTKILRNHADDFEYLEIFS